MTKKQRQQVYDKYGGRCAYCGCELQRGWHVDHLEPVRRSLDKMGDAMYPERDNFDNWMPSCPSCNINKHQMPLEEWRLMIAGHVASLNRQANYRMAKRFGQLVETPKSIVFYFEKMRRNDEKFA